MKRNPASHLNADGTDLLVADPDPGSPRAACCGNVKVLTSRKQNLLEAADVSANIMAMGSEIQNRVGDQLARTMKRHAAAAPDPNGIYAKPIIRFAKISNIRRSSKGIDWFMLDKQKVVGRVAGEFASYKGFLKVQSSAVWSYTEVKDAQGHASSVLDQQRPGNARGCPGVTREPKFLGRTRLSSSTRRLPLQGDTCRRGGR